MPELVRKLLGECWKHRPGERPDACAIVKYTNDILRESEAQMQAPETSKKDFAFDGSLSPIGVEDDELASDPADFGEISKLRSTMVEALTPVEGLSESEDYDDSESRWTSSYDLVVRVKYLPTTLYLTFVS